MEKTKMKKWIPRILRSKTMIAFILIDIAGVIQLNSDFLSTILTPTQFGWVLLTVGIIGKTLRTVTNTDLKYK
jgi:uncharacterized membrane protein HdeD (DUF308 family)